MHYRPLANTGIQVSELCLGTMNWRWTTTEAGAYRVMNAFERAGGNFLDSADIYSFWVKGLSGGSSETIIGKWMKKRGNRRRIILATKGTGKMWEGPTGKGLNRAHIIQACEDSLKRLQTDYIDLYQSHFADADTPIEETLSAYRDLIRAGKVRYIGCSNYTPGQFAEALVTARATGLPQYVSIQPYYNILSRRFERENPALCRKYGVAVIPYSPLAGGFLSGKYRKGKPVPDSRRAGGLKGFMSDEKSWNVIGTLERMGKKRGKTILQMALAWLLAHEWMTAPIVGASTPEQLGNSLGAVGVRLTSEETAELNEVSSAR